MTTTERVALNIRTIAKLRRIAMKDLQAQMGMSPQVFFKRLKGDSKWTIDELEECATILDVDTADLLRDPSDLLTRRSECFTADEGHDLFAAA
jgi:DNA-binding Xre family transcriptional regulator